MVLSPAVVEFDDKGPGIVGIAAADLQHIVLSQAQRREPHIHGNGGILQPLDLAELDLVDGPLNAHQQDTRFLVQSDGDSSVTLPLPSQHQIAGRTGSEYR